MRRWILDLHLYLGLVCLPYVVLLGLSSILLNHQISRDEPTRRWEQALPASTPARDLEAATRVRDALGLSGTVLPHTVKRAETDALRFVLLRPARRYEIELGTDAVARVREQRFGVLGVITGLHGLRGLEASRWGPSWGLYTELASFALVFAIASGLYLFWPRRAGRALGFGAAGLAVVIALAIGIW